jgi:hypothetical protein
MEAHEGGEMGRKGMWKTVALIAMLVLVGRSALAECVGDCDRNGNVPISEAQRCVNVGSGNQALAACQNADQNLDGTVSEAEVNACIASFLDPTNCPAVFTPVPTDTRTITPTLSPTLTNTPTSTATDTAASTLTPSSTATSTPTNSETPTNTPTVTQTRSPLGLRVFSIGTYSAARYHSPCEFLSTSVEALAKPVPNLAAFFTGGDLKLMAGAMGPDGKAPLSVVEDVIFGYRVALGQVVVCFRIQAAGSEGFLRCQPGPRTDVKFQQATGGDAPPGEWTMIEDPNSGLGGAVLKVKEYSTQFGSPGFPPLPGSVNTPEQAAALCATGTQWDSGSDFYYTTGVAFAIKGEKTMTQQGESFSCDAWNTEDGPGMLVVPMGQYITFPSPQDSANVMRIADVSVQPPATPTRTRTPTRTPTS